MKGRKRPCTAVSRVVAALLVGGATAAVAQQAPQPSPTSPDKGTIEEPVTKPEKPASRPSPQPRQGPAHVPPDASGIDLSEIDTPDLELLYFDPAQTYLTPYIGRAFRTRSRFHEEEVRLDSRGTARPVLLKDFGDYGNAAARSSPNNAVLLDVAPLSQTMETFSPGERFFTLNNHELTHVATMDVWNQQDAFWRRFFHGKPMPIQEHPESILWNFLATPRNERPALVSRRQRRLLRDLDGGRARPRPGRL